eukprot:m.179573 g.179573  ORF g.179573 m.179573 type:complete len:146 (-) comp31981_c0_seq1:540-977(-)
MNHNSNVVDSLSPNSSNDKPIVKEKSGWLQTQQTSAGKKILTLGRKSGFKENWFVLDSAGKLSVHAMINSEAKTIMDIQNVKVCDGEDEEEDTFSIEYQEKTWILKSHQASEIAEWKDCLRRIKRFTRRSSQYNSQTSTGTALLF